MNNNELLFDRAVKYINTALKGDIEIKDIIRKVDVGNDEFAFLKDTEWIIEWPADDQHEAWYVGLSIGWESVLSRIVFGDENEGGWEVSNDLVKEFVDNLIENIVRNDEDLKQKKKGIELDIIKPAQLTGEKKIASYSFLQIVIEGNIGPEKKKGINLTMILVIPPVKKHDNDIHSNKNEQGKGGKIMSDNDSINGKKVEFEEFGSHTVTQEIIEGRNIEILKDVEMNISVELGRKELPLGEILQLVKGSVVALDKMAGEPVEILVNGFRIAQGEVVVIDEHFGVRITGLVSERERIKSLG
ncbi:MAG TPA: flagellar motor switch protein FliN [Balneolales bacterium]|nr:flagellar motor switch protein FliN [Balneolales bacterium]